MNVFINYPITFFCATLIEGQKYANTNRPTFSSHASQSLWTVYYIPCKYIWYTK